jgi:hypothetical protein
MIMKHRKTTGKMPQVYVFESVEVQIPIELTHMNPIHSKGLFDSKDLYRKFVELNPIKKIYDGYLIYRINSRKIFFLRNHLH